MKSKIVIGALLLAVLATMVVAMSASAAPSSPTHFNGKAVSAHPKAAKLTYKGTTQIKATAQKPVSEDSATLKKMAEMRAKVNRALPGKASKGQAPANLGAPDSSGGTPTVSPTPIVGPLPTGLKSVKGLNAWDNVQANNFDLTPPDQGLCVGNGYVVEPVNVVLAVYNTNFTKLTGDMSLNGFFGLAPDVFTSDPKCYYDPGTNRFFMTMLSTDPYGVSFFINLAVSQTSDPRLGWYLYAIDTTNDCPSDDCLPDQPLLGANRDGIFISANMFSWNDPLFFGANVYMIDKSKLATGALPALISAFYYPMCEFSPEFDGGCSGETPYVLYSVQPAFSPNTGSWDNHMGGIEYFLGAYDFVGEGDYYILLMAITNTTSLHGLGGPDTGIYLADVYTEDYIFPWEYAVQKYDGLIPTGMYFADAGSAGYINPNDDRMNQVVYANKLLWSGVNTMLWQRFQGTPPINPSVHTVTGKSYYYELHDGIAWWGVLPQWDTSGNLYGTVVKQGYVAPAHEDAVYPSIGMSSVGKGAIAFTLTGPDYYPSSAWVRVNATEGASRVLFATKGQGTLDDFCEYYLFGCPGPRFGDYSAAVAYQGNIFLASEYVQYPNCDVDAWLADPTCGATRSTYVNWGTSLSAVVP